MKKLIKSILCSSALITSSGFADGMFKGDITWTPPAGGGAPQTKHVSYNSIQEINDAFSNDELKTLFPAYTNAGIVTTSGLTLRGLPATYSYAGTALTLAVPDAGINEVFDSGTTRDASEQQLKDFFKGEGNADALISKLFASLC